MTEIEEVPASAEPASAEMQRAEELVDQIGHNIGRWISRGGFQLLKGVARAREEAEDIWAEAQDLSRRGQL
jgi:hypothetical protein